jgi:hypothetical protein
MENEMSEAAAETEIKSWFQRMADLCIEQGAPEGWEVSVSEMLGNYPTYSHYQFKGAVYPPILRGPRKGRPNYKKPVPGTERTYVFDVDKIRAMTP